MKIKKVMAGAACMLVIGSMSACSRIPGITAGADPQSSSVESYTDDGWKVNSGALDINENADAKAAFEKAAGELLGVEYQPVYLLGTQIAEGTNYCVLAKTRVVYPDAESAYALVYIYEDLSGSTEVCSVCSLAETIGVSSEKNLVGGWKFNQDDISLAANEGANTAFAAATATLDGAEYDAIGCLASQVVAGMNYCIACRVKPAAPQEAEAEIRLVFLYAALDGSAEITEEIPVDIAAYSNK